MPLGVYDSGLGAGGDQMSGLTSEMKGVAMKVLTRAAMSMAVGVGVDMRAGLGVTPRVPLRDSDPTCVR